MFYKISYIICFLPFFSVFGQPDFTQKQVLNGITFYQDFNKKEVYYFLPNDLDIITHPDGKPDFQLVMMRYVGTSATGDQGKNHFRNLLQFGIAMKPMPKDSMKSAQQKLIALQPKVVIKPMPISYIETLLTYVPVNDTTEVSLGKGSIESGNESGQNTGDGYWQERYFTLRLDNNTAELFEKSLEKGSLAISLGYAFYGKGKTNLTSEAYSSKATSGNRRFLKMKRWSMSLRPRITNLLPQSDTTNKIQDVPIKINAFELTVDIAKYPDLIKKIDINESMPPGYATLSVYNFDFNNELRPDLYEKTIEFEATGAGGGKVKNSISFQAKNADLYSFPLKFNYAVRLDLPYRFRIIEISQDGNEKIGEWTTVNSWTPILDITTKPAEVERLKSTK